MLHSFKHKRLTKAMLLSASVILPELSFLCKKPLEMESAQPNAELLQQLVTMRMPFGKYKDTILCDLPVSYLEWFQRKGFPPGKMGMLLETLLVIKMNGLMYLLDPLRKK